MMAIKEEIITKKILLLSCKLGINYVINYYNMMIDIRYSSLKLFDKLSS